MGVSKCVYSEIILMGGPGIFPSGRVVRTPTCLLCNEAQCCLDLIESCFYLSASNLFLDIKSAGQTGHSFLHIPRARASLERALFRGTQLDSHELFATFPHA